MLKIKLFCIYLFNKHVKQYVVVKFSWKFSLYIFVLYTHIEVFKPYFSKIYINRYNATFFPQLSKDISEILTVFDSWNVKNKSFVFFYLHISVIFRQYQFRSFSKLNIKYKLFISKEKWQRTLSRIWWKKLFSCM